MSELKVKPEWIIIFLSVVSLTRFILVLSRPFSSFNFLGCQWAFKYPFITFRPSRFELLLKIGSNLGLVWDFRIPSPRTSGRNQHSHWVPIATRTFGSDFGHSSWRSSGSRFPHSSPIGPTRSGNKVGIILLRRSLGHGYDVMAFTDLGKGTYCIGEWWGA